MSFEIFDISEAEYDALMEFDESHFFERKSRESFEQIAKTLSAFSNADGGRLVIGLPDHSKVVERKPSYENQEAANGHISDIMRMFSQAPDALRMEFLRCPGAGGILLDISVDKSSVIISALSGEVYLRKNAQNLRLKAAQQVQELSWKKGRESYENVITDDADTFIF